MIKLIIFDLLKRVYIFLLSVQIKVSIVIVIGDIVFFKFVELLGYHRINH
jgi:hypothetical protein